MAGTADRRAPRRRHRRRGGHPRRRDHRPRHRRHGSGAAARRPGGPGRVIRPVPAARPAAVPAWLTPATRHPAGYPVPVTAAPDPAAAGPAVTAPGAETTPPPPPAPPASVPLPPASGTAPPPPARMTDLLSPGFPVCRALAGSPLCRAGSDGRGGAGFGRPWPGCGQRLGSVRRPGDPCRQP